MSENGFEDPYDEEPTPEVYRRRRLIALVIVVIVLLLVIWGIVSAIGALTGNKDEDPNATGSVVASTSAKPFSDFSERASESTSATPTESASESASVSASESAHEEPTETASASEAIETSEAPETAKATEAVAPEPTQTTPAVATACTAENIKVNLTADQKSYAAHQNPAFAVTYTNSSGNPCLLGGETPAVDINITSGPAQVYNLTMCQPEAAPQEELAAGASETKAVSWDRSINALGCGTNQSIKPGYYWITATVNGVASEPTRIVVTG